MAHHIAIGQEVGRADDDVRCERQLARFRDEGKDKFDGFLVPAQRCKCPQPVKTVGVFCHDSLLSDQPLPGGNMPIDTFLLGR